MKKDETQNNKRKDDYKKFSKVDPRLIKELLNLPKPLGRALFQRINYKIHLQKGNILKQAFEENLFTEKEYKEKYKDMFYDDYGSDSFMQYINALMNAEVDVFVTLNERMLKRKGELEKRFGLRIASPQKIVEKNEKSNK